MILTQVYSPTLSDLIRVRSACLRYQVPLIRNTRTPNTFARASQAMSLELLKYAFLLVVLPVAHMEVTAKKLPIELMAPAGLD